MFFLLNLRLKSELEALGMKYQTSYAQLAAHVTELKLDHKNGQAKSARLDEFLGPLQLASLL